VLNSYPLEDFVQEVLTQREVQLARSISALSRYGLATVLGADGAARAHEGSANSISRLIGISYLAHGGSSGRKALSGRRMSLVAVAQEMFSDASLIHDDIMDRSDMRRGHPSLHCYFAGLHAEADWLGDSTYLGRSLALLIGDAVLVASDRVIAEALGSLPTPKSRYMLKLHHSTRLEQVLGQAMDTVYPYLPDIDDPERVITKGLEVIEAKTARCLAGTPLALGAAGAGASRRECAIMMDVGKLFGRAYQLYDDVQGAVGDPAVSGKPVGQDLIDGKRTVLIGLTLQALDATERRSLASALLRGDAPPVEARVNHLQKIIRRSGALEQIDQMIADCRSQALELLEQSELDKTGRQAIAEIGDWLLTSACV
jgi:geranylgeranyl diphosphate synthase type I